MIECCSSIMMVLQHQYNLHDEQVEYQMQDRLQGSAKVFHNSLIIHIFMHIRFAAT